MNIRPAAVAGTWYPGTAGALTREVDTCLEAATGGPGGDIRAVSAFNSSSGQLMGVTPNFNQIRYVPIKTGRWINIEAYCEPCA